MRIHGTQPTFYDMTSDLRDALENVQKQMATGQTATRYGEMGLSTQPWLDYSRTASQAEAYGSAIERHQLRIKLIDKALQSFTSTVQSAQTPLTGGQDLFKSGALVARNSLSMLTELLNVKNGTVPLFAGGAILGDATISADAMIEGDANQPGLRALINERVQAETGGNDLGRLTITGAASTVTLTQNGGVFGYRILGVTSSNPGVASSAVAGPPPATIINSTALLASGDTITVNLGLPDGAQQNVTLTIGEGALAAGRFDGSAIASALTGKITALTPALKTAAAMQVAQDFFAGSVARVSQAPAAGATALASPMSIQWYLGTQVSDPRASSGAQVAEAQRIGVGVQANEQAFIDPLAALAATAVLLEDPAMKTVEGQAALQSTMVSKLSGRAVTGIQVEFGVVGKQLADAKAMQDGIKTIAKNYLADKSRADTTALAAELLALQNQLQAAYQAGVRVLKLTLTDYI